MIKLRFEPFFVLKFGYSDEWDEYCIILSGRRRAARGYGGRLRSTWVLTSPRWLKRYGVIRRSQFIRLPWKPIGD